MTNVVLPRVHVMVLCDEIEPSSVEEDVFDLRGVRTHIVAPAFPYTHPLLRVYLQMTGHEGVASGRAIVTFGQAEELAKTEVDSVSFLGPLAFIHIAWNFYDCTFPEPGVYYVQVFFDEKLIHERALFLYPTEAPNSNGQATP